MAVLAVEITLPHVPITSLQKRMVKGVEQLYYAKLFLSNPAYDQSSTWRDWLDQGFHVATYSPPPAAKSADRVRVRVKAPSPKPVFNLEGANTDALKDLDALLRAVDSARPSVAGGGAQARRKALHDGESAACLSCRSRKASSGRGSTPARSRHTTPCCSVGSTH